MNPINEVIAVYVLKQIGSCCNVFALMLYVNSKYRYCISVTNTTTILILKIPLGLHEQNAKMIEMYL